jgi:hypothetical protein
LLASFEAERQAFLSRIVTAHETWVHHFEPETKKDKDGTDRAIVSRWCKAVQVDGDCGKIEFGDNLT